MSLANHLGASLHAIDHREVVGLRRLLTGLGMTLRLVVKRRPVIVVAQNPSLILCVVLALMKKSYGFYYVIDAHNHALELYSESGVTGRLARWVFSKADLTLVTNSAAAERIPGIPFQVLPDALPAQAKVCADTSRQLLAKIGAGRREYLTFVSSFNVDEPLELVIEAVNAIPSSPPLYITGKKSRADKRLLNYASDKIKFVDYLPDEEYQALLHNSLLVIDLTTRRDCIVCGFGEALSAGVPILLSKNEAYSVALKRCALFTENSSSAIKTALEHFFANDKQLPNPNQRRQMYEDDWQHSFMLFKETMGGILDRAHYLDEDN